MQLYSCENTYQHHCHQHCFTSSLHPPNRVKITAFLLRPKENPTEAVMEEPQLHMLEQTWRSRVALSNSKVICMTQRLFGRVRVEQLRAYLREDLVDVRRKERPPSRVSYSEGWYRGIVGGIPKTIPERVVKKGIEEWRIHLITYAPRPAEGTRSPTN